MPKISARIRSFFGPKGRKSRDRSRGRNNRRSSEPVVRGTHGIGVDKKSKVAEKRTSARPDASRISSRTNQNGAKPSSPLANPQSDSNPSSLAKVENSDSEWLVVDKHRDILIENPEIQNADSIPSYSTHMGRSRSAANTPKSRSEFLDTDFALPSGEQTAHLLVPGRANSHTTSTSVPSSPALGSRSSSMPPKSPASLAGENARSLMLRSMLPDPPNTAIRNSKSSRSASLTPSAAASDTAASASGAPGTGRRSESTPVSSLHPTLGGKVSTTPVSNQKRQSGSAASSHMHVATSGPAITQQISVVLGEADTDDDDEEEGEEEYEEEEEEGEEDDAVIKLTNTLHKFSLRIEESDTVDRLVEEEYEGREGNSGDGSSIKSEKRFVCNICQNAFKFKRSLTRHMKSTHEGGFGTCRVCGDVNFSQKVSYEKHLQKSQKHLRKLWELIASRDPSRRKADYVVGGDADPARAKFDRAKLDASLRELALDNYEGIVRRVTVPSLSSNPFKPEVGFLRQCPICNIIFQNDREFIRHCASHHDDDSLDVDDSRLAGAAGASAAGPGNSSSRSRSREIDRHLSVHRSPVRDRSRSPIRSRAAGASSNGFQRDNFSRRSASSEVDPAFRGARGDSPLSVHADDLGGSNNMYANAMAGGGYQNYRAIQPISPQQPPPSLNGLAGGTLPQRIQSTFSDTLPLELGAGAGAGQTSSVGGSPSSHAFATIPQMMSSPIDPRSMPSSLTNAATADYSLTAGALSLGSGDGVTIKGEFDMLLAGGGAPTAALPTGGFGTGTMAGLGLGGARHQQQQQHPNIALDPRFVAAPLPPQDVKPLIDAHDLSTAASLGLGASSASAAQLTPQQFSLPLPTVANATQGGLTLGFPSSSGTMATSSPSQLTQATLSLSQAPALGDALPPTEGLLSLSGPDGMNVGMSMGASMSSSGGVSAAPLPLLPRQNSLSSNHGLPPPNFRVASSGRSLATSNLDADVQALISIPWTDADEELIDDPYENAPSALLNTNSDPMLPTGGAGGGSSAYDSVFNTSASAGAVLGGLQMPTMGGDSKFDAMDLVHDDHPTRHFLQTAQLHQESVLSHRTIKLDMLTRAAARERSKKQLLDDDTVVVKREKMSPAVSPKSK